MNYHFEWDPRKARSNLGKHRVAFPEATTVFRDPNHLTLFDVTHSHFEDRWITLGLDQRRNLLVVIHTYHQYDSDNAQIRIISARKAKREEAKAYYT